MSSASKSFFSITSKPKASIASLMMLNCGIKSSGASDRLALYSAYNLLRKVFRPASSTIIILSSWY